MFQVVPESSVTGCSLGMWIPIHCFVLCYTRDVFEERVEIVRIYSI